MGLRENSFSDSTGIALLEMVMDSHKAPAPQTVASMKEIMERDAEEMLKMKSEISDLKCKVNQLQQKLRRLKDARNY